VKALIVDDHAAVHMQYDAAVRQVYGDVEVLHAMDLEEAIEHSRAAQSLNLVLLDLGLPNCEGIQALIRYRDAFPESKVVVVSMTKDADTIWRSIEAGACGYITKDHRVPQILSALSVVASGRKYIPDETCLEIRAWKEAASAPSAETLTHRQLEVLRYLGEGLSNLDIAQRLGIAEDTVKHHLSAIYTALDVGTRTQAIIAAKRLGLLKV